jgi:peptidoglycan biosynthesis protein MviN/MurJ (putative lipid II flippase)
VVAFRFPQPVSPPFGEGAFNSARQPLFARRLEGEGPSAREFAEEAMAGLGTPVPLLVRAAHAGHARADAVAGWRPASRPTPKSF